MQTVQASAFVASVYALVVMGIRIVTHETFTADEVTQLAACLCLTVGIYLAEERGTGMEGYNVMKVLLMGLMFLWTKRVQVEGPSESKPIELQGKTVLITGGNSGIGLETAKQLWSRGAMVIVASRNVELAQKVFELEISSGRLAVMQLDLESFAGVRDFAQRFTSRYNQGLDIFIHNAGSLTLKRRVTTDGFESMMQTNCLSPFLLLLLLLPVLKRSNTRVVVVSSSSCKLFNQGFNLQADINSVGDFNMFYTYAKSKFALNQLCFELANKIRRDQVTINLVHPGCVSTDIVRDMHWVFRHGQHLLFLFLKSIKQGSRTQVFVATNPLVAGQSGKYYEHCQAQPVTQLASAGEFFVWAENAVGTKYS
ncbi:hypothetical protein BASA81_017377 [Batrachochytrium salamandrivorans]|nr:hypothetical protein BASA81_017377 [Batrachochytrium salamandrivorans]